MQTSPPELLKKAPRAFGGSVSGVSVRSRHGGKESTYIGQLRDDDGQHGKEVYGEVCQVVMSVVGAQKEEGNGHAEQEFLGRRVLRPVVNLLPHIQVIIRSAIELKGHA